MAFRKRVRNKRKFSRKFNKSAARTKGANIRRGVMRGGFRL